MSEVVNLGKVSMTAEGNYDPSRSYDKLAGVAYNGLSWVSRKKVPEGVAPSESNSAFWQKISDRGERGPQGQSYVDKELVPIVDNLTTGGSANVLSAEQGKVLKQELTELESKNSPSTTDSTSDSMTIADENGNEILAITDHLRTKSFDSKNISLKVATLDAELESKVVELKDKDAELESKVVELSEDFKDSPIAHDAESKGLTFADENGNEIGGFVDGHVTSRFPSPYAKGYTESDLDIADEKGRVILSIKDGYPRTRLFDGKTIADNIKQLKDRETEKLVRDIPENRGVLNAYKKIQQIVNLQWTELSNSHDLNEGNSFPRERVGTPYSEVLNVDKFIAFNVSLKTFMTAVHNPYSLFYTEDLRKPNPTSGYGFEYENYDGSTWIGPYYGQVCNILVLQAIGLYVNYYSYCFKYLSEIGLFEKVYDQTPQGLKLMDIIWEPGHACIVTDIYRNNRGEVKRIYLSEHNGRSVTTIYNPEQLQQRMDKGGDIIYRYRDLYKNLDYTPSEFVAVEDEVIEPYKYNDDICTFAGDDAAFVQGQIIYLNYNKGNYHSIELYKNDGLIQTLALNSSSSIHRHNLTSLNLTHGMYKARLVGNGIVSDYTRFEIIDAEVSSEKVGEKHRITFASEKGKATWVSICTANGRHKAVYQLTDTDINNGYAEFNIRELSEAQRLTGAESTDKKDISEYELFVKVYFQGEYGNVPNKLVSINL